MKQPLMLSMIIVVLFAGCVTGMANKDQDRLSLFEAIRNHDLDKVKKIVSETDVDLDPPTQPNIVTKALAYASIYGNLEIVKFILKQGVEIDGRVSYAGTALLRAMEVSNNDIAVYLIEAGANVNIANAFGISAMTGSAIICNKEMIDLIISHGGDINKAHKNMVSTGYGEFTYNPIQWAVAKGHKECVKHLIDKGASLDVMTSDNKSLLELAKKTNNAEIIKLIEQHF